MNNQGPIVDPDLQAVLNAWGDRLASRINCVRVGTVLSFDVDSQSVAVQLVNPVLVYNTPAPGSLVPSTPQAYPIPPIIQAPLFVLSGGGAYVSMPVSKGDLAIVLFNDRDLDPWWTSGTTGAAPNSGRMHSLSDAMVLVGIRPATNPLSNLPSDGQHIGIGNASGTLRTALDNYFTAMDAFMQATLTGVISGTTFNAATVAAMTAAKTEADAAKLQVDQIIQ